MNNNLVTLYEVYDLRSLHEPLATLPILDRDRDIKVAKQSARDWGGVVFKCQARILQRYPMIRELLVTQMVFVCLPKPSPPEPRDQISLKDLKGKLRQDGRVRYRHRQK